MLFNTFAFAGVLLPLTLMMFWASGSSSARRGILLTSSLIFYGYWYPQYLPLLVGLVAVAWWIAVQIAQTGSRSLMWVACAILLGALAYFKYAHFLGEVLADIGAIRHPVILTQPALPLGISFIVFQALGYVIDVKRGQYQAESSFLNVLLFKAFFPQLIAGPICRASDLLPQLKGDLTTSFDFVVSGAAIFAVGFLIKQFFADSLSPVVDGLFQHQGDISIEQAWAASIGFGAQIFADFWGYSTMAVGIARMFGITIPVNFRLPYLATSLRDFWRRWHITLSSWLRDYLYKPLGGSWHGRARTVFALMATMLLGGLWHGANYTFVCWGAIHGVVMCLEHLFARGGVPVNGALRILSALAGWFYTLCIVLVSWVFFRAADVGHALKIVQAMLSPGSYQSLTADGNVSQVLAYAGLLAVVQIPIEGALSRLREGTIPIHLAIVIAFFAMLLGVVMGAPATQPFIYFQF